MVNIYKFHRILIQPSVEPREQQCLNKKVKKKKISAGHPVKGAIQEKVHKMGRYQKEWIYICILSVVGTHYADKRQT